MYRRAWLLMAGVALVMAVASIIEAIVFHKRLVDPDGSFLGPSWIRLPLLLFLAIAIDLVPRAVWKGWRHPADMPAIVRDRWRAHWNRDRLTLVATGVISFYVVYVTYRNMKSILPEVIHRKYDRELHLLDRALLFGHDPATVLHGALGTGFSAYLLSYVYLWFLPMVPLVVTAWLVWSRNLSYGYWFVSSQCVAWALGTASYYALPTLGPGLYNNFLYTDLPNTPAQQLMNSLYYGRKSVIYGQSTDAVQSVAGFASLHVAITVLVGLMIQYTMRQTWLKVAMWIDVGLTATATLYYGWHYISDDVAGLLIALVSFYVGGVASGQKFANRGLYRTEPATAPPRVVVAAQEKPSASVG